MTLPTNRTTANTAAEHVADHNTLHGYYNEGSVAWQAYTPTWTNLTIGNATVTARYIQIGKTVRFFVSVTVGSTTSFGSIVKVSLPVTAAARAGTFTCLYRDNDVGVYPGSTYPDSTTVHNLGCVGGSVAAFNVGWVSATLPFTWVATDEIHVSGVYEAA